MNARVSWFWDPQARCSSNLIRQFVIRCAKSCDQRLIVGELSKALERLGADVSLLATVSSIGDTMSDALAVLRDWNAGCL
jgi:hypothetical protein